MKFTAFRDGTADWVAVVLGDRVEPLTSIEDFWADAAGWKERAKALTTGSLILGDVVQIPAVPATAKVICAGLNYKAHADEGGRQLPDHPNLFARWASTLVADGDAVPLPAGEPRLDYEAELVVVMGATLHGADRAQAQEGIFGYACGNDVTARGYQHNTSQWALGKNADRSGPIGPVVTSDVVGDLTALSISCRLNGVETQHSTLGMMIFPPAEIISYASGCLTLRPGDVIFTGTPEGVGYFQTPQLLMTAGDVVEVEIERVGVLTSHIVDRTVLT